jgi:SanA protein
MQRPRRRLILWTLLGLTIAAAAILLVCDQWLALSTTARIYADAASIPARDVGLLLGTRPIMPDGRNNLFFTHRIEAAAALFKAGKVRHLIVSGDNGRQEYDETTAMKDALLAKGVPADAITMDYAGFRTLDSVVRAKLVFGQSKVTVISQAFHDKRALFIADHSGIDAIALAAPGVGSAEGFLVRLREVFARAKAVADLFLLGARPKFAGPPEPINLNRGNVSPAP